MKRHISTREYRALAEWRYRIRHFIQEGDSAAVASGLEPQQYLMLLAIRGLPTGEEPKISVLAERLAIKHHSAVELIDRLQARGLVRRKHSSRDRRQVLVSLLPRGQKLLEKVVLKRIGELRASGAALVDALRALIEYKPERRGLSARYDSANSKGNVTDRVQRRTARGEK